ncbi:PREDICTED: CCR4-NOT transcription complex subunit 10 [Theobroma cacao]|uniref:CCR4-NOT transcription complex subunit 10 n=1 Tax=Theobroma cacao TaxID=3641 RepID=A0AB32UQF0_THECC|nr:PREDICTED: CCR4-NOT transcription complex subunit 10 [Theobroma cacao]XP_017983507.1 PREDICTED: CCR4-NOT transcription complex subunit 10 [Theobroma cacao]
MDSRDSSSSSAPNRDGAAGDDDGVLSVTAALAKDAALYFQSRKFAECVDVLNQLKPKKEDDPKVLHNIAIAEFFRDGCSDPKKLLEVLNNVKKRSEELAHASGEQVESGNNVGNKGSSGSKGSGTITQQFSGSNSASIIYTDEFDTSVAALNIAVIWFHLHEYAKALSVLEPLYQSIEPIDETTALHICLLLLDVVLACHDASKSADVLNYLEKAFGVGNVSQGDNGNMVAQQSTSLVGKSSSVPSSSLVSDTSSSDLAASVNASENPLSRTLSEDPLDEMFSTLDIGGQNLARSAGLTSADDLPRTTVDRSISGVDLKLKLQLYKVQFLLLTRNVKIAKREVKLAMNIARGRDSSMALLLKAQLEYARGNHRKAIKLLMASSNRADAAISSMFNNNLGCIYYQLGKYHTSAVFFSKALSSCSSLQKEKPLKLLTFSQDKSLVITYNCGLQYLACGKPILAARCFQKASLIFYKRPLLWLRLAECCLMAAEKGLVKGSCASSDRSEIRVNVIGKGRWRQLLIEDGISRNGLVDSSEKDDWALGIDGQPKLSLSLARQCLYDALHLLNCSEWSNSKSALPSNASLEENEDGASSKNSNHKNLSGIDSKASTMSVGLVNSNGDVKEPKGGTNQEIIQNSISYYEGICRRENQMIKQALLANLAYVELELENPLKALSAARSLLELPGCSRIYIFLGHVYVAEALCLLNKPKEAAEHLSFYLSEGNNVELPFGQEDCEQWRVEKPVDCEESTGAASAKNPSPEGLVDFMFLNPEEARGTLYANLAAVSAIQGELERAHHFLRQALSLVPNSSEATMTAIYVDLMLGKSQDALSKLKRCSHVRFLPSSLQLNKSS